MKRPVLLLSTLLMLVTIPVASAQSSPALSTGAGLLFAGVKSRLFTAEKNRLFKALALVVSKDKKHLVADFDKRSEYPYNIRVYPTDLNRDGAEDVFILYGNRLSGGAGADIVLFTKDKAGAYQKNLGFPAALPDVLATTNLGYPDLLIGGPGVEFPVWRWNGKEYALPRKVKDQEYGSLPGTAIETLSKAYVKTVNN